MKGIEDIRKRTDEIEARSQMVEPLRLRLYFRLFSVSAIQLFIFRYAYAHNSLKYRPNAWTAGWDCEHGDNGAVISKLGSNFHFTSINLPFNVPCFPQTFWI